MTTQSADPGVEFVSTDGKGNEVQGVFIATTPGVVLGGDRQLHPCWTDFRGNPATTSPNQDLYAQSIRL